MNNNNNNNNSHAPLTHSKGTTCTTTEARPAVVNKLSELMHVMFVRLVESCLSVMINDGQTGLARYISPIYIIDIYRIRKYQIFSIFSIFIEFF